MGLRSEEVRKERKIRVRTREEVLGEVEESLKIIIAILGVLLDAYKSLKCS